MNNAIQLYRHQQAALAYLRLHRQFALLMEQGTGKTLPVLVRILELAQNGRIENALVIAPGTALGSWERDMQKFSEEERELLNRTVTLVSYDMVWRREAYRKHWSVIVLDESHKIKRHTARRSKCILQMAPDSDYRYILTGTLYNNGALEDVWSQFAFLFPEKGPRGRIRCSLFGSYYDFLGRYAVLNRYHKPCRYRNISELQDIVAAHSYRTLKKDCLDLPEKLPDEICDVPLMEKKIYRELHKSSAVEKWGILAGNPLSRMTKLRQFCSGFLQDGETVREIKCGKLAALEDLLEDWNKKLVIFCAFRRSVDSVGELLNRMNIPHVVQDGRQKDKNIWKRFQTEEAVRAIICQYQSANAGIDLYAADTILFYEPTLSSQELEQAKDRIHRIGQEQKCSYLHFITKGSVEESIFRALQNYRDFNEAMFEGYLQEYIKGGKVKGCGSVSPT